MGKLVPKCQTILQDSARDDKGTGGGNNLSFEICANHKCTQL